ncbi:hypothetical protein L9F63_025282 [Diploptera punctata]|uniref:Poly [ADP-ribose] polymerase n=1 Tax=Diploptera punctata TaxID=6984 RepID=A0AAD8E605_DIPPU|nr:hypothetical protein L9F63_025282 [Diploptera punctata]
MQPNPEHHLQEQNSSEDSSIQDHDPIENLPVKEHESREDPSVQELVSVEDPPIHVPKKDPPVQEFVPINDPPVQEHVPRVDPPVQEHVPSEDSPVQLVPILLTRPVRPLSNYIGFNLGYNTEYRCEVLLARSSKYIQIKSEVERTLKYISIEKIEKVYNPFLRGCYLLKKAEYESRKVPVRKMKLFHATAQRNVGNTIIKDNLDWRRVNRARFGPGVSFANTAEYANMECSANRGDRSGRTPFRALIRYDVLVGNVTTSCCHPLPPAGYDTTSGRSSVYVKYYDNEFYPKYVVYYTA